MITIMRALVDVSVIQIINPTISNIPKPTMKIRFEKQRILLRGKKHCIFGLGYRRPDKGQTFEFQIDVGAKDTAAEDHLKVVEE